MATRKNPATQVKKIRDLGEELRDWMGNFGAGENGPDTYPHLVLRILASLPGGEELEDLGYEPIEGMGWHEADLLGRVLEGVQGKMDVEEIVAIVIGDEDDEEGDDDDEDEDE